MEDNVVILIRKNNKDVFAYYSAEKDKFMDSNGTVITDFEGIYAPVDGKIELIPNNSQLENYMYGYRIII